MNVRYNNYIGLYKSFASRSTWIGDRQWPCGAIHIHIREFEAGLEVTTGAATAPLRGGKFEGCCRGAGGRCVGIAGDAAASGTGAVLAVVAELDSDVETSSDSNSSSRQANSASRSSSSIPSGVPYDRPRISLISPTSSNKSVAGVHIY